MRARVCVHLEESQLFLYNSPFEIIDPAACVFMSVFLQIVSFCCPSNRKKILLSAETSAIQTGITVEFEFEFSGQAGRALPSQFPLYIQLNAPVCMILSRHLAQWTLVYATLTLTGSDPFI